MPRKGDVVVSSHERSGGWEVRKHGNERATAVMRSKADALRIAKDVARRNDVELIVREDVGGIRGKRKR
jgi:hypothetical protein